MRKTVLLLAAMAIALLLASGVALAATIRCDGGPCEGTKDPDTLRGSADRDVMYGFGANDKLYGNGSRDLLHGGHGADEMYGGPGNDDIYGEAGADYFYGGSGGDRMTGGPGRDRLFGGLDNDTIASQDGVFDVVDCGPGSYDAVVIDRGLDAIRNCENVYWQK